MRDDLQGLHTAHPITPRAAGNNGITGQMASND
ncbi:hypothetical protein CXB40_02735 [Pseudomonas syringae pv. avii]|uniref:Uncharacterized protein n=1 Tax=Pseudomonas syringae pv. tomato (strain ATCC BAA-871 / DC3000) TaxID=223283 RepID=Q886L2_PSESM|nr:hypothetical protein PSPTO_1566 [Pseudomonas syringae pv. tomato str. DC3000]MBW8022377.1 hypothetical protein [Pseudomonas syringae pv. tomato]POQ09755.1 hypothetical protein CXB40_02735 [Pseudomonas syringae pv. avii]PYD06156.1 hypothetical protein DND90_23395 [Pseudomonas syringae pv. maculicola]QBI64442.1 hypothetical protein EIZ61_24900 [Pseudomonas syringae]